MLQGAVFSSVVAKAGLPAQMQIQPCSAGCTTQANPCLRPLLQVLTFGTQNDEPEWVRKQFFLGVHGVIADDVAGVAAALSSSKVAM